MKKLLYLILLIPFTIFGQTPSIYLQNGATISLKGPVNIYVQDGTTTAIQSNGTSGFYVVDNGVGTVDWNIQNNSGTYVIPYISSNNENVPVTIDITAPGTGTTIKVSNVDGPSSNYPVFWDPNSINRYWTLNFDSFTTLPQGTITLGWMYNDVPGYTDVQLKYYKDVYSGVWTNNELDSNSIPLNTLLMRTTTFPINSYLNTLNSNHTWTLMNPNTPLPVTCESFKSFSSENMISLNWTTDIEINNQGFTIERSSDAQHWDSIGWVQGNGNSTQQQSYWFYDNPTKNTLYYYRLKQIDFDNQFEYVCDVLTGIISDENISFDFYPNPATSYTQLFINTSNTTEIELRITNIIGQKVLDNRYLISKGDNKINLLTNTLASGNYNITLISESNNINITRRLVIVK